MQAIYRNLNAHGDSTKLWSISNAHVSTKGYMVLDRGVTHGNSFGVTDVVTTNPQSIATGCNRINRNGSREVVAYVGGSMITEKPAGERIGRLTLTLAVGAFQVITVNGDRIPFDAASVSLWFDDSGCSVYR